jgi:hypothetical protein
MHLGKERGTPPRDGGDRRRGYDRDRR